MTPDANGSNVPRRPPVRGTTLIEAMVALAILLIGMLGTMQLQVLGVTSTAGARSNTQAFQYGRELAQALSQLRANDPLLNANVLLSDVPPPEFGHLLVGSNTVAASGFTEWEDAKHASTLPGVTTDAELIAGPGQDLYEAGKPAFRRRWQIWRMPDASATGGGGGGLNVVAVSVMYREPRFPGLREVVLLTQVSNKGLSSSFVSAYR